MKKSLIALLILLTAMHAVAETRIRIVGFERKSEMQVLELMGGRLEHVRQKDASASRADDAAFLLTQVLRKDGYANATVEWKLRGRSEIVLSVKEGGGCR